VGEGVWNGPFKLGPAGIANPGSFIAASQQFGANQTDVFLVDKNDQLNLFWVVGEGVWNGPYRPQLPPPLPNTMTWGPESVTLPGITALGGSYTVVVNSQGDWTFSGHMHDSGFDGYNYALIAVIATPSGIGYTFTHQGYTQGTIDNPFGPNRDDNWTNSGNNPSLRDNWAQVVQAVMAWQINSQDEVGQVVAQTLAGAVEQALKELAVKGIEAGSLALIALI
ncbi:MAG: hypothetical protein ACYT04_33090, partial [Nostoc sp.]